VIIVEAGKVYGYSSRDLDINPTILKGFLREATWASTWVVFGGKGRGEKGKDNKWLEINWISSSI
jgi:hypothetical protein